jgi:multiple sugar transport system substrate-binding protein
MNFDIRMPRRSILKGIGAAGAGSFLGGGAIRPLYAQSVAPITIVINQSPWFESFRRTVEAYEAATGNKVELDVNPFAGSLEKQRNSVRASEGQYDILIMNSGWFTEMYAGGFVEAITDIDPGFKLDPEVYTLGDTVYYNAEKKTVTADGKLMSVPISPLIPMLYYRGDLYREAGLQAPKTFADLEANARKFHNPPDIYGIVPTFMVTAAASSRTSRRATTASRSIRPRAARRSTTTFALRGKPGIPRPPRRTRPR